MNTVDSYNKLTVSSMLAAFCRVVFTYEHLALTAPKSAGFDQLRMSNDLAAVWEVALSDGVHRIEFEHGTTTGKRVIYVDGKVITIRLKEIKMTPSSNPEACSDFQEVLRRDWMFKLVGKETFNVGQSDTKATINIDAVSGFAYEYTLEVNGKSLKQYMENRSKVTSTWLLNLDGTDCRIVLGKSVYAPLFVLNQQK